MAKREQYVRDLFRRVAPTYDFLNRLLSFRRDVGWRRFTAAKAGLAPGARVLDIATGTGDLAFELARYVGSEGQVVGLDFVEEMLVRARAKAQAYGLANICQFVQGNALDLPFPDDSFDAATIAFGLRNVTDRERCLAEMRRVVRPGGRVLILEFSHPVWPVFRQIYFFYFRHLVPLIGRLIQGDPDTYRYLPETVLEFPDQEELAAMLRAVGLRDVHYYNLTGGISCLHVGVV
ncbi:MAG: bifunctional demethylmenaquinone methyltransferase/2-methoxy-6-polyprenyl-1,4-benzoquinol methylase [Firmicutes bacterium ZCTH02-B6]|nr:MAG: bifunctional demethylmenaquinone methyltransferase/2-methoxy-6-polyprenyl-1,4-benzoquinol methylase [Firmicutes bacterium ZCTH02-B6]